MNVSSSTYPAVVCLSPSIGSSQADPKLSLKGHGPYAAEANCDVDHYLTNCVHRGCTDALRLLFYSGARIPATMPPRAICQTREIFELPMTSERLFRLIEMVKARVQGE